MVQQIVGKWWSDKLNIGVTADKEVYALVNNTPVKLIKEYHMNRPHYRLPGTSNRISDLAINRNVKLITKTIQHYCPF